MISEAALNDAPTLVSQATADAFLADRAFEGYVRRSAAAWRAESVHVALLSASLTDMNRFVAGVMMIALHTSPGGLSLTRLKEALRLGGLAPARAAPMIALLRFVRMIEPAPHRADNRVRAYRPTERMATAVIERFRLTLGAAAPLDEDIARALERYDEGDFAMTFVGRVGEIMLALSGALELSDRSLDSVSGRTAGMMLLGHLLALAEEPDRPFPPVGQVAFNVTALARACGISRTQVRRILRAGAQAGLFRPIDEGRLELTAKLAEHIAYLCVGEFITVRWAAARMIEERGA